MKAIAPVLWGAAVIIVALLNIADVLPDWATIAAILTLPFLENLRRSAPEAEISVVVLNRVYDLARSCRWVDRVIGTEAAERGPVAFQANDAGMLAAFAFSFFGIVDLLAILP